MKGPAGEMTNNMHQPANLPRILCLHGGGTSGIIFKIQLRRLVLALRQYFTFVFVTAPLESGPGPGVVPAFTDCGPYYRWITPEGQEKEPLQLEVREILKDAMKKDGGEFVGVLGFSQGAMMAAGLLIDQEEGDNEGMPEWKFGVMLCGGHPPSSLSASRKHDAGLDLDVKKDEYGEIRRPDLGEMIRVPSVHMRGLQDVHLERGRRLAKFFSNKIELEFDQGHHLPGAAGDTTSPKTATADLADAILRQYGVTLPARTNGSETPEMPQLGAHASLLDA